MSYNLKNKYTMAVALAFLSAVVVSYSSFAQIDEESQDAPAVAEENIDLNSDKNQLDEDFFGLDNEEKTDEAVADASESDSASPEQTPDTEKQITEEDLFAVEEIKEGENPEEVKETVEEETFLDIPEEDTEAVSEKTEDVAAEENNGDEVVPVAPKSPFESFGNAILSKVDNDLFTQMSNIEKQNTILNLQIKREELKNKVEALRVARQRAREEEDARRRAEEERLKDLEVERKTKLMSEEAKLKEKETALERVRQGKVLNEYMNEMLVMNQKWIEENTALHTRIRELEQERVDLIKNFEGKMNEMAEKTRQTNNIAQKTLINHQRAVATFNSEIMQLRQSVVDAEARLNQSEKVNSANPFANVGIDQNAIDMSQEYAIMDITGKGNDIVAKIVGRDGTTFIVHRGSMLKGGEVVTAIYDNYIAFDNKGIKSYLYTGGTVMEYEPVKTFNGSDRTPAETTKKSVKSDIHNVRGATSSSTSVAESKDSNKNADNVQNRSDDSAKSRTSSGIVRSSGTSSTVSSGSSSSSSSSGSSDIKTMSVSKGMFTK